MKNEDLNKINTKYGLDFRLVIENDAEKILQLRTDTLLSRHLHKTLFNIKKQIQYIREYKIREQKGTEFYFAYIDKESNKTIGFSRIHDIDYKQKTFTIGSWIFQRNVLESYPILADILLKEYGFEQLNLESCFFDVRKMNKKVIKYHKLFSPEIISEDEANYYFCLKKENFENNKNNLLKILI